MNGPDAELWRRICDFSLDASDAKFTFTARLTRENGWSVGFARRVVEEYKRFVFLAMAAGHVVTPSDAVDEAWHLHLIYSKSYWDGLCHNVLGCPLHHIPSQGGPAEAARHREQYKQTLASYCKHFGETAPTDIWPPVELRFGKGLENARVSRSQNWIVPRPRLWPTARRISGWLVTTAVAPMLVGIVNPFEMTGPEFLVLYGILTLMVIVAAVILRMWLRTTETSYNLNPRKPNDLDPIEVGCLGRGSAGVLQSCLAGLVADGRIKVIETPAKKIGPISLGSSMYKLWATVPADLAATDLEREMLSAAVVDSGVDAADILKAAKPIAETVESKLESCGLLETNESFGPARWWPLILVGGLASLGALKLVIGLSRGKPVSFLVMWLFALAVVALLFAKKPRRTRQGDRVFKELQGQHESLKTMDFAQAGGFTAGDMMLVTALFGLAATSNPDVKLLQGALKPIAPSDGGLGASSGSCGSGCGGCGGGCGGCGD